MTAVDPLLADAFRDQYLFERELGRGGMATVYLARDLRHERPVALKVLHPELAATLGPERFLREIKLAARLQHPHILPVFDSGTARQRNGGAESLWFTMPYVEGESLRQRLTREPQLPLDDAVRITLQVADALGYAHARGIVHRDVKPENILLSGDHCVMADFGVARALDAAGAERLTETGLTLGTPAYMSPEQAAAERHLNGRSDIYSLGCVVYEMLAGEPPFTGRTAQAIIARRMSEPVPRLRTVREVPEEVESVITKALARSPADRFADAPGFARALQAAAGARRAAVSAPQPRRRKRVHLAVAGTFVVLSAAAGLFLRLRPAPDAALDPNLLAVAPFDVLDPTLQLWREGLGDILSRSLDGAGSLRTVSPTVAIRRWQGRADRTAAESFSRRIGAGLVVYGAVVPKGRDSVSIRAHVLDGTSATGPSDVEVSGETARIGELADSLGIRILQILSRSRSIGSVRQVSMGSRSLPALKAFLQGEQFYRRGLWDSALTRYDQAVKADSTFALALRRMHLVLGWNPPTAGAYRPDGEYAVRSHLWNQGLSPRESLLIVAESLQFASGNQSDASDYVDYWFRFRTTLEEAVRRYPEDPEVWYVLAEARHHSPRPIAPRLPKTFETFERVIALDPGFAPAYEHMVGLASQLGRPEVARRYAATYLSLDPTAHNAPDIRLAALMLDPVTVNGPEAARLINTASRHAIFSAGLEVLATWPDSGETAIRLLRRIGEPHRSAGGDAPWVLDSLMWPQFLAHALAFRGHLREAFETDRRLLLDQGASEWSWFVDPFPSLSLLGALPDSVARAVFARGLDPAAYWGRNAVPRHLLGLPWWLAHRDTVSLAGLVSRAGEVANRSGQPSVVLRARLLGAGAIAYGALARGDSARATQLLETLPDTLCLADNFGKTCSHLNLTLGRLLAARGDYERARDLLEDWRWTAGSDPMFVLATLELGRVTERLEDKNTAIECYRFVTDVWRRADPELQPYVTEAREALARLAERG